MAAERDQGECEQRFRLAAGATVRPEGDVNLSAKQFWASWAGRSCGGVLSKAAVSPDDLRLEVTESSLMSNADTALETMQGSADAGA